MQSIAKTAQPQREQVAQQVQEKRQRQGLAPNQPLQATPAPRCAGNTPKQPAPSRDAVTLKELRGEIDNALAFSKKQDAQEQFNSGRSAFSQITPTQQHHVGHDGSDNAHALRMHGGALAVQRVVCGAAWVTVLASAVSATAVRFAAVAELIVPEASVAEATADCIL